jgi:glutathione S-transferase
MFGWPRPSSRSRARTTRPGRCAAGCCARWPGIDFEEVPVSVDDPGQRAELLLLSPSFLVPALTDDGAKIWDTLAIAEYLHESFPKAGLLPADRVARAHCRSISGEMHSGFQTCARRCR